LLTVTVQRGDMPLGPSRPAGVYPISAEFVPTSSPRPDEAVGADGGEATGDVGSDTDTAPETDTASETNPAPDTDPETPVEPAPISAHTAIVWNSVDAPAPVPLSLVVPLVLPQNITTLPTAEQLSALSPRLTSLLDAGERHGATLAVDPRILAGIRALGTQAPSAATTLLDRLGSTPQPVFLLQYADADPAVQAALGFDSLMQPLGLSYAVKPGALQVEVGNADGDASIGTDQPTTDTAESRELAALTELPNASPGAWPAAGEVDSATLALLSKAGLTSLVLDSAGVAGATGNRVTFGNFGALVADTNLTQAGRAALAADTSVERAGGTAELAARLGIAAQGGSTGLVLALDRGAVADSADPLALFDAIDTFRYAQTVPAQAQPEGTATLRSGAPLESRRELLRAAMARSEQIDALAPLLAHPEYLRQYQRERLLEAFATRYAGSEEEMIEADTARQQRDAELLRGVRPITSEHTQLVGTSSRVPITLSNALPFDASVTLWATPLSAAITTSEQHIEATVPAAGNGIVLVPVHSRVSSGDSGLALEVRDASGEQTFAEGMQHLVLRTAVETIMLASLGAIAALLLGFGVWRSVRARRANAEAGVTQPRE